MPTTPPPNPADPADGTIAVSGTGRVAVVPDTADLRLGLSVARPSVDAARMEAAGIMEAILRAVDAAGVARRDVRTTLLSVQPRYDYRDGKAPTLTGYELANAVEVTIRDLARLGDVVDGVLKAGATSMDGLSFRSSDPAPAEREARHAAMADARSRADVLAEAAGLAIVGVADIIEGNLAMSPGPQFKADRVVMAEASTPIETGTTEIAVTVAVTYRAR
ncbi:MAG: SIMPL domain-containing protein [Candidatus Limnocylindrales bacterium]